MSDLDGTRKFVVLLVEDSNVDARLTRAALEENHFNVELHHAIDGREGIAFLRREAPAYAAAPRPDMILLDLNMPRMNGREFLAAMKTEPGLADIPVVVLTTSDVEQDVVASYQLGAAGFVTKPVDLDQFIEAVRYLGDYWFNLVRIPRG
ncbi:response regulator [Magnetospirillum moscoviense]|uniref:Response regulator n=1 Tax=Magnetospirillum moscoviense TaxID=1437059 RepID=A0A178MK57_9PROT|nr:response regulator [Magnetospirillum moscoviense]OAN48425.1 response regulator [Magnetospirillum moscoviense]